MGVIFGLYINLCNPEMGDSSLPVLSWHWLWDVNLAVCILNMIQQSTCCWLLLDLCVHHQNGSVCGWQGLRDEHWLRINVKIVLGRIFGPKEEK
jgi:hypothetical protein